MDPASNGPDRHGHALGTAGRTKCDDFRASPFRSQVQDRCAQQTETVAVRPARVRAGTRKHPDRAPDVVKFEPNSLRVPAASPGRLAAGRPASPECSRSFSLSAGSSRSTASTPISIHRAVDAARDRNRVVVPPPCSDNHAQAFKSRLVRESDRRRPSLIPSAGRGRW